jgi:uncharacterized membrane protein YhaH (DUF805 family)
MPELLFSYSGRIGIRQFWWGLFSALMTTIALAVVVGIVLGVVLFAVGAGPETEQIAAVGSSVLIAGYAMFTQLALTVKRLHDSGRSGWWCLMMLVPFVGLAWLVLDVGLKRSTVGEPPDAGRATES